MIGASQSWASVWFETAVIRIYDVAGNVIDTHAHKGDFKEP